jgi:thiol-disulfide isomerase/thioredoxin
LGVQRENEKQVERAKGEVVLMHATAAQLLAAIRSSGRKGTIVNAWASWCGPCRREVPMLQALAANLKPQGVEIVLVSVDEPKDEAKALAFLKDNAITLKSYLVEGSVADFKEGINPNWPGMLPASFLFDRSAKLVHFWGGEAFENEIVPVVESFLAGRPVEAETRYGLAPGKVE